MTPKLKRLDDHLRHDGFDLDLVDRFLDVALYKKTKRGFENVSYEVALIRTSPARTYPDGTKQEFGERYPANERWGTHGWSFRDKADALAKFERLCKARSRAKLKSE